MAGLSQRAYARHRGVTHRAVQKAIKTGRITINPDGTIDSDRADVEWQANTDPAKQTDSGTNGTSQNPRDPQSPASRAADSVPPIAASGYFASRAVREAYRARREKLQFERESAAMVPLEEVRSAGFTTGRRIREHLLTLADRVAPLVAGIDDRDACHRVISDEVERALEELEAGALGWRK
jgi:hypothetical protein